MFRLASMLATLALAFTFQARAEEADVHSEFFHQAEAHTFEVTPILNANVSVITYKDTNIFAKSQTITSQELEGDVSYGLNENYAVGLTLGMQYSKSSYNARSGFTVDDSYSRGMVDPHIYFNGRNSLPAGTIHYGVDVHWALEDARVNADLNTNAATGGKTVEPYVGYDITLGGRHTFGGKFGYEVYKSDSYTDTPSSVIKTTGGNAFDASAFYEFMLNKHLSFGGAFALTIHNGSSSNKKTGTDGPTQDDHNAYTGWAVGPYVPYHVTDNITLLGRLSVGSISSYNGPDVDANVGFGGEFGARFAF